jgi:protein O-mannosyl-transferase
MIVSRLRHTPRPRSGAACSELGTAGERRFPAFAAIALPALVAAGVYANTLANGLAGDDPWTYETVAEHPEIWREGGARCITYAFHALDLWIGGGSFAVFHATNVALHALASALAASVARRLSGSARVGLLTGVLFAVHPVHVEAVASFSNRKDILAMVFLMLALTCWLARGRVWVRLLFAPIFFALALYSKEVAAIGGALMLPAASLVVARRREEAGSTARPATGWIAAGSILLLILAAVGTRSIAGDLGRYFEGPMIRDAVVITDRYPQVLATTLAALPSTLRLLTFPADLSIDYPVPTPAGFASARVIWGALLAGLWVLASILSLRRCPILGYGCLWVLVMVAPISNVLPITEFFVADRYLYVPSFGWCLVAALGIDHLWRVLPGERKGLRFAFGLLVGALVVAGATRSVIRNRDWADQATLHASAWDRGFHTARVHRGVGYGQLAHGVPEAAEEHFRAAIALDARLRDELAGPLAAAQTLRGRYHETASVPRDPPGLDLIGIALLSGGQRRPALQLLRTATQDDPRYGSDLAWVLAAPPAATAEDISEAQRVALPSVRLPGVPQHRAFALCAAAVAATRSGDFQRAARLADSALELAERSSDEWIASVARFVSWNATHSRPVVMKAPLLFGVLWRTRFAYYGEPRCESGTRVRVVHGNLSFDAATESFNADLLNCGARRW